MNAEPDSTYGMVAYGALGQRPYRIVAGLVLSLLVHAVLLFGWRYKAQPRPADAAPAVRSIAVWLRPPPPPPPEPAAATAPKPPPERQARTARRPAKTTELIAIPKASPATPVPPDVFTVAPPPDAAPRFDPDAAKKLARQIANDPKVVHEDTAAGQVAQKELAAETKAARAIGSAKRRDCKDGLPGGLLAPLFLLMDKKDSGCKW